MDAEAKENVIDPVPKLSKKASKGKKAEVEEAAAGENTIQKNIIYKLLRTISSGTLSLIMLMFLFRGSAARQGLLV